MNLINFKDKTFCIDCGKELTLEKEKIEDKEYIKYRREKLCPQGKHKFICQKGEVYCKYCGEVKENIGFASVASGNKPLRRGAFEDGTWGKR